MTQERPVQPHEDDKRRRRTDGAADAGRSDADKRSPLDKEQHPIGVLKQPPGEEPNVPEPSLPSGAPD